MKHFKSIQNLNTSCKFSTLYAVLHLASVSSQQQKARSITPAPRLPAAEAKVANHALW
ncbi:hypothetical protein PC120_g26213, partial [Phytophthora cactorum]